MMSAESDFWVKSKLAVITITYDFSIILYVLAKPLRVQYVKYSTQQKFVLKLQKNKIQS